MAILVMYSFLAALNRRSQTMIAMKTDRPSIPTAVPKHRPCFLCVHFGGFISEDDADDMWSPLRKARCLREMSPKQQLLFE